MIASMVTAVLVLAWFTALAPRSTVNNPTITAVWFTTITVWLASRRLLRGYRGRAR